MTKQIIPKECRHMIRMLQKQGFLLHRRSDVPHSIKMSCRRRRRKPVYIVSGQNSPFRGVTFQPYWVQ